MRGDLRWALMFFAFPFAWLGACGGAQEKSCTPESYRAAVSAAYAPHVKECAEFPTVEECPGYWAAKAEVAKRRQEFVECR